MTTQPDPGLVPDLVARNLIAQSSAELPFMEEYLNGEPRTLYCGFDPTAGSLHIGHLVPLLMLRRFQLAGHRPLALIGGATGMIGDPSFKATERSLNSVDQIDQWVEALKQQIGRFLDLSSATLVNNRDWTAGIGVLEFLRDIGKYFSVNSMINKDSVRTRIERPDQGISFTEFSYSLLQSWDFAVLNRDHQCSLQLGGNDQWGNITAGIDLTRRMNGNTVYGMTLPLITKADGTKFGKTESGTVWLDPERTSPYRFYQFWLNTADADVYRFLKFYSFLPVSRINAIEASDAANPGRPQGQQILAEEITRLVHGETGLQQARRISASLFSGEVADLAENELQQLALDGLSTSPWTVGDTLTDALVNAGLASSRRNSRELLASGAVMLNGRTVTEEALLLTHPLSLPGGYHLLRKGKKHFALLIPAAYP
ncbi:tyrosine--tRNA ligase [Parathalassolituus penaei]|uniref:Tyrosine--tRNA ligase n=1 Tax=Parathalassolituus penaei TaxID=2997323 RepID=A0A9X3IVM0_9GAMM|nr:tyrosine--tRNA ligase [Parathalassolituus penaei]MCY0967388.1 tyrosine--tRNA ligase [Parathalassolituus penaei]